MNALEVASGSAISRLNAIELTTGSLNAASGSAITRLNSIENKTGSYATTGSNTFDGGQYFSSSFNPTGFTTTASLYTDGGLRVTKDAYISGTLYLNNVTVFGTQSVAYISSSQLNIGTNIITVNTDTPSVRFGGLAVYDSGSTGLTGSMLWDSQANHWVYSNPSGSNYSGGMLISGPRTAALGSETGTTSCMLLAGQGGDHLTSSMIYHSSTVTCIPTAIAAGSTACFAGNLNACSSVNVGLNLRISTSTSAGNATDPAITTGGCTKVGVYFDGGCVGLGSGGNTLILTQTGKVGIGTQSPDYGNLSIYCIDNTPLSSSLWGTSATSGVTVAVYNGSQCANSVAGLRLITRDSGASIWNIYNVSTGPSAGALAFGNGSGGTGYEKLRITDDGITCFACTVCAPVAIFSGCVSIGGADQGYQLDVKRTSTGDSTFDTVANFYKASTHNTGLLLRLKNTIVDLAANNITGGGGPTAGMSFSVSSGGTISTALTLASTGVATFTNNVNTGILVGNTVGDGNAEYQFVTGASTNTRSGIAIKDSWNGVNNNNAYVKLFVGTGSGTINALSINYLGAATFSSTISGTTIYGSTAVCSPVGKFTTCIDAGTGYFSGNVNVTVANTPEVLLTHSNTSKTFLMAVDGSNAFFRANSTNNILFQYAGGTTALNINGSTGVACFSSTVCASTFALANGNCITALRSTGGAAIGVLGFTSGTDTLFIKGGTSGAATSIQFQDTGGTIATFYDSKLGIGITSPCASLHVSPVGSNSVVFPVIINNQANCPSAGYGVGLRLQNSSISGGNENNKWAGIAAIAGGSSGYSNDTDLAFYVGCFILASNATCPPVEKMRIQSSTGYVGIGTTSPSAQLQICSSDGQLKLSGDGRAQMILGTSVRSWQFETSCGAGNVPGCGIGLVEAGYGTRFQISPGGVACFQNTVCMPMLLASGCIGIGTTSPAKPLEIRTGGSNTTPAQIFNGAIVQAIVAGEPQIVFSSNISPSEGIPTSTELARAGIGFAYISAALPSEFSIGIQCTNVCNSNVRFFNGVERMKITSTGIACFACIPSFPGANLICSYTCTYSSYTAGCWLGLFAGDNGYNGAYAFTVIGQFSLAGSALYQMNYSTVPYIHSSTSLGSTNGNDFYALPHTSAGHADNGTLVCFRRARYSGNTPAGNRTEFCMNATYNTSFTATTYVLAWV